MLVWFRSLLFALYMLLCFLPFTGYVAITFWLSLAQRYALVARWNRLTTLWVFEHVLGLRYRVIGRENLPDQPSVILAKHQSTWETLAFIDIFPPAAYVAKRELLRIPLYGWGMSRMPVVTIDRSGGKDALRQVVEQGCAMLAQGYWVVIFPEGTRTEVGGQRRYKIGGAKLASTAGCAIVPVAHNAGEFWRRNAFIKHPGEIVVSIGPAISTAGRSAEDANAEAEAWIEGEMRRLFPHHYQPDSAATRVPARVA
jgi:1-acyl-sn-glycerol-3-phosphate acyltransferase